MNKHCANLAILSFGLLFTASAPGAPVANHPHFLWKVTSGQHTLYIAGMPALLQKKDYPLPKAFEQAFARSGELITEGDGPAANQQAVAQLIRKLGMLPDGQKLTDILSENGRQRLEHAAAQVSLPVRILARFKPWTAALLIDQRQLKQHGIDPTQNMLFHFYREAKKGGIHVVSLESAEHQIRYFAGLSQPLQIQWLTMAETSVGNWNQKYKMSMQAWRNGDADAMARLLHDEFKGKPKLSQALVTDRNEKWASKIGQQLKAQQKPIFVVVGAGHLVGPHNLLDLFRQRGYTVSQI